MTDDQDTQRPAHDPGRQKAELREKAEADVQRQEQKHGAQTQFIAKDRDVEALQNDRVDPARHDDGEIYEAVYVALNENEIV